MEIKFEKATEPAVKGTIAVVACVTIAYVSTHADTPYGFVSSFLIGIIGVIIGTYKTPSPHGGLFPILSSQGFVTSSFFPPGERGS
jgi:hypothetical protein